MYYKLAFVFFFILCVYGSAYACETDIEEYSNHKMVELSQKIHNFEVVVFSDKVMMAYLMGQYDAYEDMFLKMDDLSDFEEYARRNEFFYDLEY